MKTKTLIFWVFLIFLAFSVNSETLHFAAGLPENHPLFIAGIQFWNEVAAMIGKDIEIEVTYIPFERSRQMLIKGEIDGDTARALPVYRNDPSVFLVSVPIMDSPYVCFAKKDIVINGPESVKNLKMVCERGNVIVTRYAEVNNIDITFVSETSQALKMVTAGRVDFYLGTIQQAALLQQEEFKDSGIKMLMPPLFSTGLYLFLNEKHKNLVADFEKAIQKIIASGRIQEIFRY